jgi:hypothetical protein
MKSQVPYSSTTLNCEENDSLLSCDPILPVFSILLFPVTDIRLESTVPSIGEDAKAIFASRLEDHRVKFGDRDRERMIVRFVAVEVEGFGVAHSRAYGIVGRHMSHILDNPIGKTVAGRISADAEATQHHRAMSCYESILDVADGYTGRDSKRGGYLFWP